MSLRRTVRPRFSIPPRPRSARNAQSLLSQQSLLQQDVFAVPFRASSASGPPTILSNVGAFRQTALTQDDSASRSRRGEWPREAFSLPSNRLRGIKALDRSALYLELLPVINAGTVELPDVPKLLRELRGLERRRGSAGRDRVEHGPGDHDDRANAVAGVANLLACPDEEPRLVAPPGGFVVMGGGFDPVQPWLGGPYDVSASDSYCPPSFRRWSK